MRTYLVTFGTPQPLSVGMEDKITYGYPFSVVEKELRGTKNPEKVEHRALVSIIPCRKDFWKRKYGELNLKKILYHYAKQNVAKTVEDDALPRVNGASLRVYELTDQNTPLEFPYPIDDIPEPEGDLMDVSIPMGFKPKRL